MLKLKLWLLKTLVQNLKQQFFNGTIDFQSILTKEELIDFTKKVTRRKSWVKEVYEVHVKKGKRKYTLLIVDTLDGQYKVNLGRHHSLNPSSYSLKKAA